ncbi:MAG TPA: fused MFS/spermidine synthase [Longimicrobiales bacterium]|nr:fused MFS/spermidine synthase [Longimicrobiales bacterium]
MVPFAALTFCSALLLFLVQPLMARAILPWFGGAASVWTTCLLFYQAALFVGYAYAHAGSRLGVRRQAALHAALVGAAALLLPILPDPGWQTVDPGDPTLRVLGLLAATVGSPYLLLAGTTPLLHAWFGRLHPGRSPYRLYSVSNAGSLLALLAYPVVVEPLVRVRTQAVGWSWAYGGFAVAMAALAWRLWRRQGNGSGEPLHVGQDASVPGDGGPARLPVLGDHAFWLALSACGAALLMSLTNTITMDVASVPLLWILPLALYLVTFVLAFAGLYRRPTFGALLVLSLGAAALLWVGGFALPVLLQIGLALAVLFVACMVCHGELARSAPDPRHLTGFYLTMAAGGSLGGLLVAVVAPAVLTDFFEMPSSVLAAFTLLVLAMNRDPSSVLAGRGRRFTLAALGTIWIGTALLFASPTLRNAEGTVAAERNFYGVLRVQDHPPGVFRDMRVMRHGRIFHGAQFLDADRRSLPTAYFTAGSGVAEALAARRASAPGRGLRIGVIGLGVGTLAAWTEAGDSLRFYEINPAAERLARSYFTFLSESPGAVDVVLGDGRLALKRDFESSGRARYDVLVVDAFAGDAVPIHLLTLECMALYRRALAPGGLLVFQVTNRHVDLERVVRGLAESTGMAAVRVDHESDLDQGGVGSSWMVLAEPGTLLPPEVRATGRRAPGPPVLWTDDFSNIVTVLRAR